MSTAALSKEENDADVMQDDDSDTKDDEGLQDQIQRMKANRLMNANQICDQIYERQYNRMKRDYHSIKQRAATQVKTKTFQERRLAKLERDITYKHESDQQFKKLEYFGFTELINKSVILDDKMAIREKLRGNFKVNIRKDLPEPLRVSQLANEPIAYFLHKKGDFLPRLSGKQPRVV